MPLRHWTSSKDWTGSSRGALRWRASSMPSSKSPPPTGDPPTDRRRRRTRLGALGRPLSPAVDREPAGEEKLEAIGIGTKPYYSPALHRLPWRTFSESEPDLPVTDVLHDEALALPMSSEVSVGEAERVFWSVLGVLNELGDDPR